jgi:hypothetical protein
VDAIHGELHANPSSDLQTSSDSWYLLRMLVEGINYHFNFRPTFIFTSADSDLQMSQSAAAACRGIKQCVAQFIELLSTDESCEEKIAAFTIFLMDSEQDAEILVRFVLLRAISRRVIAVKRPGQRWGATIDGASVLFDENVAPVLHCASAAAAAAACGDLEEFDDAKCAVCLCTVYEDRKRFAALKKIWKKKMQEVQAVMASSGRTTRVNRERIMVHMRALYKLCN